MQYSNLIPALNQLAMEAGEIIMKHFKTGALVERKEDNSPVTLADRQADDFISAKLRVLAPDIPVISEEGDLSNIEVADKYWLVDPLDGTRSFIKGEPEFTVNIGLIIAGRPVLGVIYAPALEILYFTGEDGKAYKQEVGREPVFIKVSQKPVESEGYRVIASKSHRNKLTEDYINTLKVKEFIASASSYKFCLVAEGRADLYPRFSDTMQWDTAAGQAILEAAGGVMTRVDGSPYTYTLKKGDAKCLYNRHFIAKN